MYLRGKKLDLHFAPPCTKRVNWSLSSNSSNTLLHRLLISGTDKEHGMPICLLWHAGFVNNPSQLCVEYPGPRLQTSTLGPTLHWISSRDMLLTCINTVRQWTGETPKQADANGYSLSDTVPLKRAACPPWLVSFYWFPLQRYYYKLTVSQTNKTVCLLYYDLLCSSDGQIRVRLCETSGAIALEYMCSCSHASAISWRVRHKSCGSGLSLKTLAERSIGPTMKRCKNYLL